jgi:hypothetical protein
MYITPAKKKYMCAVKKLQDTETDVKAVTLARYLNVMSSKTVDYPVYDLYYFERE